MSVEFLYLIGTINGVLLLSTIILWSRLSKSKESSLEKDHEIERLKSDIKNQKAHTESIKSKLDKIYKRPGYNRTGVIEKSLKYTHGKNKEEVTAYIDVEELESAGTKSKIKTISYKVVDSKGHSISFTQDLDKTLRDIVDGWIWTSEISFKDFTPEIQRDIKLESLLSEGQDPNTGS